MHLRLISYAIIAAIACGCSQQDKKPRLAHSAVVGVWRSADVRAESTGAARTYTLRMTPSGMAEFTSDSAGRPMLVERGTWDGADSLVRVVVRGDATAARPTSMLLAIRGNSLGLVEFDTTAWGAEGLTLHRR